VHAVAREKAIGDPPWWVKHGVGLGYARVGKRYKWGERERRHVGETEEEVENVKERGHRWRTRGKWGKKWKMWVKMGGRKVMFSNS